MTPQPPHPTIEAALRSIARGESLSRQAATELMELLMTGQATGSQFGALLMGLVLKGETVDELVGMVTVMRDKAVPVSVDGASVDTCGTGGDGSDSFNVSTTAAFVVAGAGATVAKHGNRAMSSQCGSADVLEALGAQIELGAREVEQVIAQAGIGFMFAPLFHPAMQHAIGPRRELRIRTVFNILGPLTNPAGAQHQVVGVADAAAAEKMAHVLRELGSTHALVVRGTDGLDELSIAAPSIVHELRDGELHSYEVTPEQVGLERASLDTLRGGDLHTNAAITRSVLEGEAGPRRDIVVLNAAAALLAADQVQDLREGVELAAATITSGSAVACLDSFIAATVAAGVALPADTAAAATVTSPGSNA